MTYMIQQLTSALVSSDDAIYFSMFSIFKALNYVVPVWFKTKFVKQIIFIQYWSLKFSQSYVNEGLWIAVDIF